MYFSIAARNEHQRLESQIEKLNQEIAKYPDGELRSYSSRRGVRFYYRKPDGTLLYLKRGDRALLLQLALKGLYIAQKEDLLHQREYLDRLIGAPSGTTEEKKYLSRPGVKALLIAAKPTELSWAEEPYEHSSEYPERLVVPTKKGDLVRSKSESLIADTLFEERIPYRYESVTPLFRNIGVPDFIILTPFSGREIVWEHFGMMDRPDYRRRASMKLSDYFDLGYLPDYNLICTFESKEHPLNLQCIEEQIKKILVM